jgi:hypothetical protein
MAAVHGMNAFELTDSCSTPQPLASKLGKDTCFHVFFDACLLKKSTSGQTPKFRLGLSFAASSRPTHVLLAVISKV